MFAEKDKLKFKNLKDREIIEAINGNFNNLKNEENRMRDFIKFLQENLVLPIVTINDLEKEQTEL